MATAKELLAAAVGELGVKETPGGSNKVKYGAWFGLNGYPWCVMFVQWLFHQVGMTLPARTASCSVLRNYAIKAGMWVTSGYQPGDVVIYDFPDGAATDHCGIIETVGTATLVAIEGNTAVGNDANGGMVMRRTRPLSQVIGAVRPNYDEESEEDDVVRYKYLKDVPEKFRSTIEVLMNTGIIQGDGSDPVGNGDVIDLSHDQVRTLVFCYRGGAFDARIKAAGLK